MIIVTTGGSNFIEKCSVNRYYLNQIYIILAAAEYQSRLVLLSLDWKSDNPADPADLVDLVDYIKALKISPDKKNNRKIITNIPAQVQMILQFSIRNVTTFKEN